MPKQVNISTVIRERPPAIARCRGCQAPIEWTTTSPGGRRMPVDHPLIVLTSFELLDGRMVVRIDAGQSHFATCPDAQSFQRRKAKR
jgi:hypothetical protein